MDRSEILSFCKSCSNRKMNAEVGLVCALTDKFGAFAGTCEQYSIDMQHSIQQKEKTSDSERAEVGRQKLLIIFKWTIGITLSFSVLSFMVFKPFVLKEISKTLVSFTLHLVLLYAIYIGKRWAKRLYVLLCTVAVLFSFGLLMMLYKNPLGLIILAIIGFYSYLIYFYTKDEDVIFYFNCKKRYA